MSIPLPISGDSVLFITPPTVVVEASIFLYGHNLYSVNLHTMRLLKWLEECDVTVTRINCLEDDVSAAHSLGPRTAGPHSKRPKELRCFKYGLDDTQLRQKLADNGRPDQVWITSLFAYDRELLSDTIKTVRAVYENVPIIVGGSYASLCPDDCARMGADHVHKGLLRESEDMLSVLAGHCGFLVAGRGCPNRCTYCAFHHIEGAKPISYDEGCILADVDNMVDSGLSLLALYAPSIFRGAVAKPTERIMDELAGRDLTTLMWAGIEPQGITPQRANLLRRAGVIDASVPLQTYDRSLARSWGRREDLTRFLDAVKMMRNAGFSDLELSSDILIGHPDQPLDETIRSACYLWSLGLTPVLFPYTCVPGSADAQRLSFDFDKIQAETLQPYLWPFARPEYTADDYIQFSMLSRVIPPLVETALGYLDPDSCVRELVERYLDEFGFSVPQWKVEAPLPDLHIGYQKFLSHPWELTLTLLRTDQPADAAQFANACEKVAVCEPEYLEVPRRFIQAGMKDEALRTLTGAIRCLPKSFRDRVSLSLDRGGDKPDAGLNTASAVISESIKKNGHANDAQAWERIKIS